MWAVQIQQNYQKQIAHLCKMSTNILVRIARGQPQISNVYVLKMTPKKHSHSVQINVIQGGISFQTYSTIQN